MKICIFTENHLKGGVDTFLTNLVNTWPEPKDSLTLMCNSSHPGLETISRKVKREIEIKRYKRFYATKLAAGQDNYGVGQLFAVRAFFVLTYRSLQYPILFPWYVFSLSLKFRRSGFDRLLVVNGGYPASMLCRAAIVAWRLSGKPTLGVMNFHSAALLAQRRYRHFEDFIDRLVVRSSSHIVTVTQNCLDTLNSRSAFRSYQNFKVIYNGIEDPLVMSSHGTKELDEVPVPGSYILMLGTYEPRKGHLFLLEAFQLIHKTRPDLKLQIYGYSVGDQRKIVSDEVERLGLTNVVELNNYTPDTSTLIRNAKVLVAPSQEYESFNLTIIEAMAVGVPVVATNVGGMPEVLADSDAGYIVGKDDPVGFAGKINEILDSESLASSLSVNGRQTFEEKYTAQAMSKQYRDLLK